MSNNRILDLPLSQKALIVTVLILVMFFFSFIDSVKSIFKILFGIAVGIVIFPFLIYTFIHKE